MKQDWNQLMKEHNISFQELALKLNINKQTITRKMNGTTEWTYQEIGIIAELFQIEDPMNFFF